MNAILHLLHVQLLVLLISMKTELCQNTKNNVHKPSLFSLVNDLFVSFDNCVENSYSKFNEFDKNFDTYCNAIRLSIDCYWL